MRRICAVLVSSLVVVSALSLVVGHAATLEVRGGIAQTFRFEMEPPAPPVELWVELREYAGNSGNLDAIRTLGPYLMAADQEYYLEYDRPKNLRTCPDSLGLSEARTGGPFTPPVDLIHVVCVQKSQDGTVVIRAGASDGPIVSPS